MQRITSRQNAVIARYRDAARGTPDDVLLLDGIHLLSEALSAGVRLQHVLVATDALGRAEIDTLVERAAAAGVDIAAGSPPVLDAASPVRSSSPIVALADRPHPAIAPYSGASPLVVVLCEVQDPGNVGAIVRTAEGAGATGVVLAGPCADPLGWKALRASMGSALRVPLACVVTADAAVTEARARGARIIASVPRGGVALFDSDLAGAIALLVGGEGAGVPDRLIAGADLRVTIPMAGPVESLNAAVSAAVLLYEAVRQRMHVPREPAAYGFPLP